jgi:hypothetical protein
MSHDDADLDARLARLGQATAGIEPRADFATRVMQRIEQEPAGMLISLQVPARRFFPISMVAAAVALLWAVAVDRQVDEVMATSDDVELAAW